MDLIEDQNTKNGVKFEDNDWEKYLSLLKPIGLDIVLESLQYKSVEDLSFSLHKTINPHMNINMAQHKETISMRKACQCRISKEIGFDSECLFPFNPIKRLDIYSPYHPELNNPISKNIDFEMPVLSSSIYAYRKSRFENYDLSSQETHMFSVGHLELTMDQCLDYWNGESLCILSDNVESKIYDFYQNAIMNDMQCIAFSYKPIRTDEYSKLLNVDQDTSNEKMCYIDLDPPCEYSIDSVSSSSSSIHSENSSDSDKTDYSEKRIRRRQLVKSQVSQNAKDSINPSNEIMNMINNQVFLGAAVGTHNPKKDVCDFIEDLKLAGIRFVYFSTKSVKESKAFAERLGLETDWNTCIRLTFDNNEDEMDDHYIKARLPRGVDKVREHLENVDDIPLQVSLFADCNSYATTEMIKIYQEYGEVVCCISNSSNRSNISALSQADISLAVESRSTKASHIYRHGYPLQKSFNMSNLAYGSLLNSFPCSIYFNNETSLFVLTQSIRESRRLINSQRQAISFLLSSYLAVALLQLFSILMGHYLLSFYNLLYIIWFIVPLIASSFFFTDHEPDTMTVAIGKNTEILKDFPCFLGYSFLRISMLLFIWCFTLITFKTKKLFQDQLGLTQIYFLLMIVVHIVAFSSTFISRTIPIWRFNPLRNRVWNSLSLLVIISQLIYTLLKLYNETDRIVSYSCLILFFVSPLIFVPIQELVKWRDLKFFIRFQKLSKLQFNTKLGLHSPV